MKAKIAVTFLVLSIVGGLTGGYLLDLTEEDTDRTIVEKSVTSDGVQTEVPNENISIDDLTNSTATVYANPGERRGSVGSAFMYSDRHLVTNQHVVGDASTVTIRYDQDNWSEGKVLGTDKYTDVAVIEVEDKPPNVNSLPIQESLPKTGEDVLAVGSPLGLEGSVSTGIVGGTDRSITVETSFSVPDMIQSDAALNEGNSGGPLVNSSNGAVIGMNTATEGENIGYAVSSRVFDRIAQSIIENGDHKHAYIGVLTTEYNPITELDVDGVEDGLVVRGVQEGTPAEGKLQDGSTGTPDIITSINGQEVMTNEDLASYLIRNEVAGNTIKLGVYRNGSTTEIPIETASRRMFN